MASAVAIRAEPLGLEDLTNNFRSGCKARPSWRLEGTRPANVPTSSTAHYQTGRRGVEIMRRPSMSSLSLTGNGERGVHGFGGSAVFGGCEYGMKGGLSVPLIRRRAPSRRREIVCGLFGLGVPEVAVIAGVVLLLFGPKKLPEVGKSLGKTVKSFQEAAKEFEAELKSASSDTPETSESEDSEQDKAGVAKSDAADS
eukprot:TRINITY_DN1657_c0_g1_i1.p1 TRINITY_DN1657_c0_g1~~TRINITY_DN1657_c0_g1_i1.p1  ORF type:complete len:198 (-),score=29.46 TRINITY_DN1657_c0_g1_i1:102-695(-)